MSYRRGLIKAGRAVRTDDGIRALPLPVAPAAGGLLPRLSGPFPGLQLAAGVALAAAVGLERNPAPGPPPLPPEVQRRIEEMEAEARTRLAAAESAAEQMRAAAAAEAADLAEQAAAEGRARGYADGMRLAQTDAEEIIATARHEAADVLAVARQEADRTRARAQAEAERRLAELEPRLVEVALAVARHVVKVELRIHPELVGHMVAAALEKLRGEERPRLRLHPGDMDLVAAQRAELLAALPGGGDVELVPDEGIAPGDFVLHSDQGTVDGRLDRQLREVAAALSGDDSGGIPFGGR